MEKEKNINNPIWSDSGIEKYIKFSRENKIKIFSFCDDYIINHSLSNIKTYRMIVNTLNRISKLKIKKYILPLYGRSTLN